MKIIIGERGSGKSTELIKEASKNNLYILVVSKTRAGYLFEKAREMGLDIPYPVTVHECMSTGKFRGSSIRMDGLLIDDADDVLKYIFQDIPIHEITITAYKDNTEYLNGYKMPFSKRLKTRYKEWKKWRKNCANGPIHKLLVLFGLIHSPSFEFAYWEDMNDE